MTILVKIYYRLNYIRGFLLILKEIKTFCQPLRISRAMGLRLLYVRGKLVL